MNPWIYADWMLHLKIDWRRQLERELDAHSPNEAVSQLRQFQGDCGLQTSGIVDAPTRLALIAQWDRLRLRLIGDHLDSRVILSSQCTESALFDRIAAILDERDHALETRDHVPQIVAIRGVKATRDGWTQTQSARDFARESYGARTHFSARKENYLDAVFTVCWRDSGEKHVRCFSGNVNPNGIWPAGTAHLAQGQYLYKIGRHRTRDLAHIEGVRAVCDLWPDAWLLDQTENSLQYLALEGVSPVEVVRSHGDSLDISDEDVRHAEIAIAHRDPAFVDTQQIKINIHTCATSSASSLGCQNLRPEDYGAWMGLLVALREKQRAQVGFAADILYSLLDASSI